MRKKTYREIFNTNNVAIIGYSPNRESHQTAELFIKNDYDTYLINPFRRGEKHLGKVILPEASSIRELYFASLHINPLRAFSEGLPEYLSESPIAGIIVNPLIKENLQEKDHLHLEEERDRLIHKLKKEGYTVLEECSRDFL